MKEKIIQIIIGFITFIVALIIDKIFNFNIYITFIIYLIPYVIVSFDSFKEAIEGISEKEFFNENLLMIIASLGAMIIGLIPKADSMFSEGIFVMLFFQVGELFEMIAEGKSEKSISNLMDIRPDYANLEENNTINKVDPNKVKIGDIIVIKVGEKVPLDGTIIEGNTFMDTLAITGESVPRNVKVGDIIYSGFINKSSLIKVKVTKTFNDSTASRIIDLVKNASENKSSNEKFISKFSKVYTPIILILALIVAIIPSIITGEYITWIMRGLTFLVVSCPCALVISVPLAYFGGIGGASKKGVLFKGSNYLESISKLDTIIFDKTGTLTEGVFEVTCIHPNEIDEKELLHIAAHIEFHSTHPIALSLVNSYKHDFSLDDGCDIKEINELSGLGMEGVLNNEKIYVGNDKLMDKIGIKYNECNHIGTIIHVATKDKYYGHIIISDRIKEDTKEAIDYFKNNGIKTVMLTGDRDNIAKDISSQLGIDKYYAELLPVDKVNYVEDIIKHKKSEYPVAFVGDGINDAPVIARSDLGISMGGIGSDAAIEASDVVLMKDNLTSIIDAIKISKKTLLISKENIYFSIFIKVLVLILSTFGITNMWMAVFADVGVTIIAVLNSMRTLK